MSDLRISTITIVSELNTHIDLIQLFESLQINDKIKYIEKGDSQKGTSSKAKRKSRKPEKKKVFFNQATIQYFHNKLVNVKLFNNGKIQMTGLKYEEQGKEVLEELIQMILEIQEKQLEEGIVEKDIFTTKGEIYLSNYRVVLINSDFDMKYPINRENLHREMVDPEVSMYSSYEPCIYPGVNIKYFYNLEHEGGVCQCNRICSGKGGGNGDGDCKKVTIAVFKSGKIIITGAMCKEQLTIAHDYISEFIESRKSSLLLS
jgi:TATA-box binding protein (TBP) (component of TFIID and TFIIIB)|tara:strand:+ start:169 stop:948 length:780 start_codon:yes stop_codon:yes gene_type:complete